MKEETRTGLLKGGIVSLTPPPVVECCDGIVIRPEIGAGRVAQKKWRQIAEPCGAPRVEKKFNLDVFELEDIIHSSKRDDTTTSDDRLVGRRDLAITVTVFKLI